MDTIRCEHIIAHVSLVYIDMAPLSALRLMACDGIGILDLQGVIIDVFL